MGQMYKVFVKEVAIILTSDKSKFKDHHIFNIKKVDFQDLIEKIENKEIENVVLYSKSEKKLLKRLHKLAPIVIAGGGLVLNQNNDFLFIHRNGKWDLPKGKEEKGETIEETSIREVKEETGVKNLHITDYLGHTYHTFSRKGKVKLKLTHWFIMETDSNKKLKPQKKEGIDKAVWLNKEMATLALKESYANIRELFPDDMLINHSR
ncbi:NUDIX hydrolase [Nonlabens dokdonensis]|jgi:ADP-ribose pyrophosphatase YjhB (NUDIX family)|uniref:AP4A hydrolase n=2 Tax=Nonlabens dokdonensis TaxID=328515 RepID=L7W9Z0_NONDD|nr:AP4A hydrolase [Nonlabens dokdonensis DSW-6]